MVRTASSPRIFAVRASSRSIARITSVAAPFRSTMSGAWCADRPAEEDDMRLRYAIVTLLALSAVFVARPQAYVLEGPRWAASSVPYYVNPANIYVTTANATAAAQYGMSAWSTQSNAAFMFYYAGATTAATLANDGQNNIFFRNDSNGSLVAETYWWTDAGNHMIDADIVVHEATYKLFTGTSGCSGGLYIEDVLTHEAGHA